MSDKKVTIDPWSLTCLQIEMYFDDTLLSHGTGSIWRSGGNYYLVTNQHNFTGRDTENGDHLSRTLAEPNRVSVYFHAKVGAGLWKPVEYRILGDDNKPLWLEHADKKLKVDIAALPIKLHEEVKATTPQDLKTDEISMHVGAQLFVIGYPFKWDVLGLPVWKRASLASEPELERIVHRPRIFVDTATRAGMSGSLVVRRATGSWQTENNSVMLGTGTATRLLGIYSGRLGANKDGDAQLGIVWPIRFVQEIIDGTSSVKRD